MKASILILDDDPVFRSLLVRIVSKEGFNVLEAQDVKSALRTLEKEEISVILSDVHLPDGDGVELVKIIKVKYPLIEIVMLTAFGTITDGVNAIKNGAFDYLTKGEDNKKLIPLLNKAVEKAQLQFRIHQLEKRVSDKFNFENIVGESQALSEAKELAGRVAQTDATVLLLGDTGTGKEIFAHAIHDASKRKLKPFVAVNCSSLGKEILESELFGHKMGAFTGAVKDKKGLFEEADGGTILLDEIGEMNIDLQSKLLRVLETHEYYKVGDSKAKKADVRVIASTNRNLQVEAEKGNFRLDLFYRLSVFQIRLPSLNERMEDMESLASHFTRLYTGKMNKHLPKMGADFLDALKKHSWKGNIRELKNVIERAVILSSDELHIEHLPFDFSTEVSSNILFDMAEVEKQHIRFVLQHTKGNKHESARLMNIGLTTLYRKIQDYQLE